MKTFASHSSVRILFFLHAALLPISIAAGQVWAYLLAVLALGAWVVGRMPGLWRMPLARAMGLFVLAALFSAMVGVRPEVAFSKMDRLLLLLVPLLLPLIGLTLDDADASRLWRRLLLAFLIGCTVKAGYDCVRIPVQYLLAQRAYASAQAAGTLAFDALPPSLFDLGNMRDPQFYAVAICIAAALWLTRAPGFRRPLLLLSLLITGAAMVLHFKRGAWIALVIALVVMGLMSRQRRLLIVLLFVACFAALLPQVRARVGELREEIQLRSGGRFSLWTRVMPALYTEYPLGMGWRSVQHSDLTLYRAPVQKKLNHLHNNALQVRLETGWQGLAAWLLWMGSAFVLLFRSWRCASRNESAWRGPALGLFSAFLALHLNGLVEYNFGDGEIFMLLNLILALGSAGWVMMTRARDTDAAKPA